MLIPSIFIIAEPQSTQLYTPSWLNVMK